MSETDRDFLGIPKQDLKKPNRTENMPSACRMNFKKFNITETKEPSAEKRIRPSIKKHTYKRLDQYPDKQFTEALHHVSAYPFDSKHLSSLISLYRSGSVSKTYLEKRQIDTKGFRFLYADFRKNGLSVIDSAYNALFVSSVHQLNTTKSTVRKEFENIFTHPLGWFKGSSRIERPTKWDYLIRLLSFVPKAWLTIYTLLKRSAEKLEKAKDSIIVRLDSSMKSSSALFRFIKRNLSYIAPVLMAFILFISVKSTLSGEYIAELYIDGNLIGDVAKVSDVSLSKTSVEDAISPQNDGNYFKTYHIQNEISYHLSHKKNVDYLSQSELYDTFYSKAKEVIVPAFGLYVDNNLIVASENRKALDKALSELLDSYKKNVKGTSGDVYVDYANKIRILEQNFPKTALVGENDIRKILGLAPVSTDISTDQSLYLFNYKHIDKDAFQQYKKTEVTEFRPTLKAMANPNVKAEVLDSPESTPKQEANAVLTYKIVKNETFSELVPFDTQYKETDQYPVGTQVVSKKGKNGKRSAIYEITYVDGQEIDRKLVSFQTTEEAVPEIVLVGTHVPTAKELATMPTGTYIMPFNRPVSSGFGTRSSNGIYEFHTGWDIPGPKNSPVVAVDGGTVSAVTTSSGYGLYVIIDHGNGIQSLYAHLNSASVKVGDKVGQGYQIGKIGKTGKATGYHVHLEIRKNGVYQNPSKYYGKTPKK